MKRKNMTRNALITSIISILLCVSMLVGATFAWFTDEVVTGMNTIAAGNLDIELYANGKQVNSETKLFDDVTLWEPGVVTYENLEIKNVGTLALKYQMTLNFKDNNDLNGHKLSEVVKVAILNEKIADNATREEVLAKAQAVVAADQGKGNLANFYTVGELEPGAATGEKTVVIFWAPNANEIDNLYNANNGQQTSDGKPLSIEFGINLQATQLMYEKDSFGNDYDENATILPKASVNGLPAQTISTTWGMGGAAEEIEVPFIMQFQPNEKLDAGEDKIEGTEDDYLASEYAKWHADFVVSADRDVPADSMALGGYYKAFCDDYNGKNWVSLTSSEPITAGTKIRLVEGMGNGAITVNYEEICRFGNDGTGFLCTAKDLTGANAGTTLTVELRLYEVEKPSDANGNSWNVETGKYVVVGTYTYTFPAAKAADQASLEAALEKGGDVKLAAGTYTFPNSKLSAGQTLYCEEGTVFEGAALNANGATIVGATFKNSASSNTVNGIYKDCTFTGTNGLRYGYAGETVVFENCVFSGSTYGVHFDGGANEVLFKGCTFSGFNATGAAVTKITFDGCTFKSNGKSGYNGINLWGDTEMIDCTFVFDGSCANEWIDLKSGDKTATFTGCVVFDGVNETALAAENVWNNGNGTIVIN